MIRVFVYIETRSVEIIAPFISINAIKTALASRASKENTPAKSGKEKSFSAFVLPPMVPVPLTHNFFKFLFIKQEQQEKFSHEPGKFFTKIIKNLHKQRI